MIVRTISPRTVEIKAPAKINLFLEVLGRRSDGFHEIETVMHSVDLFDEIRIDRGGSGVRFSCNGLPAGPDADNLARRAALLFFSKVPSSEGAAVHLHKAIPAGAGLGGGSSDAAAVLEGLNLLFGAPLNTAELVRLGGDLGSDVPFFSYCGTGICRGRGEKVEPVRGVGPFRFLLIFPGFPTLTKDIYENLKLDLTKGKKNSSVILNILKSGRLEGINQAVFNRLQEAAFRTSPLLEQSWYRLKELGLGTFSLSGTGSALFRIMEESDPVPSVTDIFIGKYPCRTFLVRSSAAFRD